MAANLTLPRVDEHSVIVVGSIGETWRALLDTIADAFGGRRAELYARVVGCTDVSASGPPIVAGTTLVGFHVSRFVPESTVELTGRHRFSTYRLTLCLEPAGEGRTHLSAKTCAEFPGFGGGAYRFVVINSHLHTLAVRRLLQRVRQRVRA